MMNLFGIGKDRKPPMLCPDCNKEPLKLFNGKFTLRCRFCSRKLHQDRANEKRKKEKEILDKQKLMVKSCQRCGKDFETLMSNQKFCFNPCTTGRRSIAESNGLWNVPKKTQKRRNFSF